MAIQKGSRVRCVTRLKDDPVQIGDTGTVDEENHSMAGVIWDILRTGMHGDNNDCWFMFIDELEEIHRGKS